MTAALRRALRLLIGRLRPPPPAPPQVPQRELYHDALAWRSETGCVPYRLVAALEPELRDRILRTSQRAATRTLAAPGAS